MESVAGARKRILVVDDHALVRAGFKELIDDTEDLIVGGQAGTAALAL
jgi:DNA-binding NarL/FixJ family response regulator